MNFQELRLLQDHLTQNKIIPATAMAIGQNNRIIYEHISGSIYETNENITPMHRFDVASLTKIFTGICFMRLVEEEIINLYDPVYHIFPEYHSTKPIIKDGKIIAEFDARKITWFHILTHTSGIGWTQERPRPKCPDKTYILDTVYHPAFVCEPGQHIVYSDIPIVLLGMAMERVTGMALDALISQKILSPLGLANTSYAWQSG